MITETGKFFSVPCERPQKWGPPFWKWQLPQTKLLGITDTRLYNDVSFGTFRAKGLFCYHRELTTLFNWLKWVCQLRYFQYRTTTTKTTTTNPYWLQQWRTCIGFFNGKDQIWSDQMRSDQSLSRQLFATPWITARQASLSITNSRSSLRLMSIESVMPSSHLILCRPLLLPPIPPSIWVFSNESTLRMRWPKYWSFSFNFMRNAGLEETQAGSKIAGRNINNLRYADDTTLMAENKEELKSLLIKMNEESEKVGLKLNIQKMKILASDSITSWQIDREKM